jgi:hypothetical protein
VSAFSDYTTLKATLAGWVHRADVNTTATGAGVDNATAAWITLFEAWASRKLREWNVEKVVSGPVSSEYVAAPADMLELKSMVMTNGSAIWPLEPAPQWVVDRALGQTTGANSMPQFYALVGGDFRYFPPPDTTYTATLTYYAGLTPLSAPAPSNWLLQLAPDAYLYGSLVAAAPYLKDMASLSVWKGLRDEAMDSIRDAQRQPSARLRSEYADIGSAGRWNIYTDN